MRLVSRAISFGLTITLLANPALLRAQTTDQRRVFDSGIRYFNVEESVCNNIGIVNGSVDRFLQVLAFQESGGNITAQAGTSSASGKYQYIDSTWRSRASIYGPAGQYARAKLAPEEVQDAVTYIEYTQKFRSMNNDLFKLAVSHFLPAALTDPTKLDVVPPGNRITPRQYADKLIQNIGSGVGSNIPLKHSQAPEFQTWLDRVGGSPPGVNTGGTASGCASSATGGALVQIAQKEMALGAKESDGSYFKYTGGLAAPWCAYFVSWIFKEAGKPLEGGPIPAVVGILALAQEKNWYHAKDEPGFIPQPGDIAIYNEDKMPYPSHVNIVVSYDPAKREFTTIGGNESNTIKQASWSLDLPGLTGFMRAQ